MVSTTDAGKVNNYSLVQIKYRRDIDGLRAIAVLSVVIYHAFPSLIKGGFLGVDIFFVISGFLISTIIFSDLRKGEFNFLEFYSRRIRRIFPALLLILISCLIFGWWALLDHEYKELGKHIIGGATFVSNLILWSESGYFDSAAETKILLHLWSLGIEEQFYIFWPLVLWGIRRRNYNLISVIFLLALISFTVNVGNVKQFPEYAFYSPQTRFWELLIGSGLAYLSLYHRESFGKAADLMGPYVNTLVYSKPIETSRVVLFNIQSLLGMALLIIGFSFVTKEDYFPGWWALLPTIGTALIISAGSNSWLNCQLLSNRLLVGIGLISFPLYLWHWPVLTFLRIIKAGELSDFEKIVAVLISIVLAWLTYEFIEKSIRYRKARHLTTALVVMMIGMGSVGFFVYKQNGIPSRHGVSENDLSVRVQKYSSGPLIDCYSSVSSVESAFCVSTESPNVAILGDSHAEVMFYGVANSNKIGFDRPMVVGGSSCPPTLGMEFRKGCDAVLDIGLNLIESNPGIKYVILAAYSGFIDDAKSEASQKYVEGYKKTISRLREMNKKIIIAMDNYTLEEDAQLCAPMPFLIRTAFKQYPNFCKNLSFSDLKGHAEYNKVMLQVKSQNPDVLLFDPEPYFCPKGVCSLYKGDKLLIADKDHLSKYGNELYIKSLLMDMNLNKF